MGELSVMGRMGDMKVIWDASHADEVAQAKKTFDDLRSKGYLAFSVEGKEGSKGKQITAFDPQAERLIMAPPLRGGM